ncbi:MAG: amidohydrolase family protein [Acetobacteraceae bacterium]|nr:amidohydrolase family protein [Acetobacteraceae bacterium]
MTYGSDNRVTLDAVRAFGPAARGIAIVDAGVTDHALDELHSAGIRGARFNFNFAPTPSMADVVMLAPRLVERGWHVQLGMRSDRIVAEESTLRSLPGHIVLEHCAGISASGSCRQDRAYRIVMDRLESGRFWVKLSGPYLREPGGAPDYPLLRPYVQDLIAQAPDRLVWGSDWPHPSETSKPDDVMLVDVMSDWLGSDALRSRIFVKNPETLYGFPSWAKEGSGSC